MQQRTAKHGNLQSWQIVAAVGLLICLVALLAQPGHMLRAPGLLLFPVLLFGLLPILRSSGLVSPREPALRPQQTARAPLFQRPPPHFSR
jgi:hypothetical protein